MATVPPYQFVRLNEEGFDIPSCFDGDFNTCLPVVDLSDIKFQVITEPEVPPVVYPNYEILVAFPCQYGYGNGQEIFDAIFAESSQGVDTVSIFDGYVSILASAPHGLVAGDKVFFSGATNSGTDFLGFQIVREIVNPTLFTIEVPATSVDTVAIFWHIPDGFILGYDHFENSDGDNVFNVSASTGSITDDSTCFRLCVWKLIFDSGYPFEPTLTSGDFIASTNCFKIVTDTCFTTKIVYGCEENAFGFYTDGTNPFEVSIRLPFHFREPRNPGEQKGYQRSDGTFVKLSERVNKSYKLETDYFPDEWHERLRIALSCDNVNVTNEYGNLNDEGIYKEDEYEPGWIEGVNYPFSKATCTVLKKQLVASVNSNCQ